MAALEKAAVPKTAHFPLGDDSTVTQIEPGRNTTGIQCRAHYLILGERLHFA
jgi:hypothetical protein